MSCAACASRIQRQLTATPGVLDAAVNFGTTKATVEVEGTGPGDLIAAVREAGYDVGSDTLTLAIADLRSAADPSRLERAVAAVRGVLAAAANPAAEAVRVTYVPGFLDTRDLEAAVTHAGFVLSAPVAEGDPVERERLVREREVRDLTWKLLLAGVVAVAAMVASMPLMAGAAVRSADLLARLLMPLDDTLRRALPWLYATDPQALKVGLFVATLPVMVWSGRAFYVSAWRGFQHRSADMNTLIGVGTAAAMLYSTAATFAPGLFTDAGLPADVYYEAVSSIIALILLGRLLESRARGRTSEAMRRLLGLAARTARVLREGGEAEVPIAEVVVGDIVLVRPGEKIPVDGDRARRPHRRGRVHAHGGGGAGRPGARRRRGRRDAQHHRRHHVRGDPRGPGHGPRPDRAPGRGGAGEPGAGAASGRPHRRRVRAGGDGRRHRRLRRLVRRRSEPRPHLRHRRPGVGAHHRLPVRDGPRHADRDHGGHGPRRRARGPGQGRRRARGGGRGRRDPPRQDGHHHRGPSDGDGPDPGARRERPARLRVAVGSGGRGPAARRGGRDPLGAPARGGGGALGAGARPRDPRRDRIPRRGRTRRDGEGRGPPGHRGQRDLPDRAGRGHRAVHRRGGQPRRAGRGRRCW